jgi:hypothetical protein
MNEKMEDKDIEKILVKIVDLIYDIELEIFKMHNEIKILNEKFGTFESRFYYNISNIYFKLGLLEDAMNELRGGKE